ncbi:MAG: hypothetical protein FWE57_01580 [Chitinispirillia bacterium]|nr:hypothetical protein [Chitinispirillia bacterium]
MKKIVSQQELYTKLAKTGDPAAFCALFRDQFNCLYAGIRGAGEGHDEACAAAVKKILTVYTKYTGRTLFNPGRWVASKCGLKNFNAETGTAAYAADLGDYEKRLSAALQRCYSDRLNGSAESKGEVKNKKPPIALAVGLFMTVAAVVFLFFSGTVISVNFQNFEQEYEVSFPALQEELWRRSGLVHSVIELNAEALQSSSSSEPASSHE